jgi:hypothetical protein
MGQSAVVDEEAMDACLKEVTKALLEVRRAAHSAPRAAAAAVARTYRTAVELRVRAACRRWGGRRGRGCTPTRVRH